LPYYSPTSSFASGGVSFSFFTFLVEVFLTLEESSSSSLALTFLFSFTGTVLDASSAFLAVDEISSDITGVLTSFVEDITFCSAELSLVLITFSINGVF
jgi:hypothetical protein